MDPRTQPSSQQPARPDPQRAVRRRGGFTLTELMVTLLVGAALLATLVPSYVRYAHRAKRTEAYFALRAIHDAQAFHFANEQEYSNSFDELGFDLEGGAPRSDGAYDGRYYTYTLDRWDLGNEINANYRATATGNIDASDDTLDIVIIENALTVHD